MNTSHPRTTPGLRCSYAGVRLAVVVLFAVSGCSVNSGWKTGTADDDFVDGTRVLGELILSTTREQAMSNEGILQGWREKVLSLGHTDADIQNGSGVTVWAYCYGHNSGVPQCAHHGHYVAFVPPEYREGLRFADDGDPETAGDIVEVELVRTPKGAIVGKLVGIYRPAADWGDCRMESLQRGALSSTLATLSGVGPPRAIWLECDSAAADGWSRRPVRGAPLSTALPVSEWIRLPAD